MSSDEKTTTVRFPDEMRKQLAAKAYESPWSMNDLVIQAVALRLSTPDAEVVADLRVLGRDREGRLPRS